MCGNSCVEYFCSIGLQAGTTESKTDRQADYSVQSINDDPKVLSLTGPAHPRSE
jgi:hypothetical protein